MFIRKKSNEANLISRSVEICLCGSRQYTVMEL